MSATRMQLRFASAVVLLALAAAAAPVGAETRTSTQLRIDPPEQMTQGQASEVVVTLQDRFGRPVQGASVVLLERISFFSYADLTVVGEATTDFDGLARMTYTPTTSGERRLTAEFAGHEAFAPATAAATVAIAPAPADPGAAPPAPEEALLPRGVTAVWFLALLVGVWTAIGAAVYQLVRIPGDRGRDLVGSRRSGGLGGADWQDRDPRRAAPGQPPVG